MNAIDTVLGWKPEDGRDMAISFEYASCLTDVWYKILHLVISLYFYGRHRICMFQRRPPEYEYFGGHVKIALPELVDPSTIPMIESSLTIYSNFNGLREPLAELILEQGYIPQLLDQFNIACDSQSTDLIESIFNIFRMLALLNARGIFDELFSVNMCSTVALIFEHDPAHAIKPDYHTFLQDEDKVKILFPLNDLTLETNIHRVIRIQYFKDVILPRYLDDEVYSNLTILVRSLLFDIVKAFDSNPKQYEKLSSLFTSTSPEVRLQVLKFFKDFIAICRTANLRQISFFQSSALLEFLDFLQSILMDKSPENLSTPLASELLLSLVQIECGRIQTWMREQMKLEQEMQMMFAIINRLHTDQNSGVRWHLVSIIRILLDPPNPVGPAAPAIPLFEAFSDYFYAQHCLRLISPFATIPSILSQRKLTDSEADLYFHLCELTSTFILLHKYKIKYLLVRDNILTGICYLMMSHLAFVKLVSLRVFRTLLSTKDEFYSRIMISSHLFEQIFLFMDQCAHRNNLSRAALLDFFVAMHETKCQRLIDELVPKYRDRLEQLSSLHAVFSKLIHLYDSGYQAVDGADKLATNDVVMMSSSQETTSISASTNDKWGSMDYAEEDYFSSDTGSATEAEVDVFVADSVPTIEEMPPPLPPQKEKEEEFGGALGGTPITNGGPTTLPSKKMSLFGSNLKNTLKSGFGFWKTNSAGLGDQSSADPSIENRTGATDSADAESTEPAGSPSKKTKHI